MEHHRCAALIMSQSQLPGRRDCSHSRATFRTWSRPNCVCTCAPRVAHSLTPRQGCGWLVPLLAGGPHSSQHAAGTLTVLPWTSFLRGGPGSQCGSWMSRSGHSWDIYTWWCCNSGCWSCMLGGKSLSIAVFHFNKKLQLTRLMNDVISYR